MIDKIRCRNGNLEISVTDRIEGSEELWLKKVFTFV
jgi:hypothetical protein